MIKPKHVREVVAHGQDGDVHWVTSVGPLYGAINGYVRLPLGHPWLSLSRADFYDAIEDIRVHGGITFGPDEDGWIGFDTLHAGDVWPGNPFSLVSLGDNERDIWWTPAKVATETMLLARQVGGITKTSIRRDKVKRRLARLFRKA